MKPLPKARDEYSRLDEQDMRATLERAIDNLERPAGTYSVPALEEPLRALTVSASQTEIREFVITLAADLQKKGVIG